MSILKIASISDIHLGHSKNSTEDIIRNLKDAFPYTAETGELDIIFIVGDVFDGLLSLPDSDVIAIDLWIANLLSVCERYNIILRILEGTPSHDWKQSERFITIAKVTKCSANVRYITDLSIEYIEEHDINVLYVPDEWESNTDKTLAQVKELLKAKGLEKVDYAIMHGAFSYQLPEFVKTHKHDPYAYLDLVKELIFIGHIHTFSKFDRIYAQGSFDRICHGEEAPKGHIRATIDSETSEHTILFIENTNAKIFKSIDCKDLDIDETLAKIDKEVVGVPDYSHVRVLMSLDNPLTTNMNSLTRRYPLLLWSKLVKSAEDTEVVNNELEEIVFVPITITSNNIQSLLMNKIIQDHISTEVLKVAEELILEVI